MKMGAPNAPSRIQTCQSTASLVNIADAFGFNDLQKSGGAKGDRTPDLGIANAALSQLSYRPGHRFVKTTRVTRQDGMACTVAPSALHVAQVHIITLGIMVNPFLWLILNILSLYFYVILATVIMSWLIGFNVINGSNPYVRQIGYALRQLTEPLLRPIRNLLPDLGGLDISPIILLLLLQFVQRGIEYLAFKYL